MGKSCGRETTGYGEAVTQFGPSPGSYGQLPEFLLERIPGFRDSPEFGLVEDCIDLPGVIVGALSPYVVRLETENRKGTLDETGEASVDAVYAAFEGMAASGDPNIETALVVEVFEHLHCGPRVRRRIVSRFGPYSRAAYDRWVA